MATKMLLIKWSYTALNLLHLLYFIQFVKSWQFFLESNSKSLFQSSQKENKVAA